MSEVFLKSLKSIAVDYSWRRLQMTQCREVVTGVNHGDIYLHQPCYSEHPEYMAPGKHSEIQFIDALKPRSQQRAHAHAARVAHARRRGCFRIIEYPSEKNRRIAEDSGSIPSKRIDWSRSGSAPSELKAEATATLLMPSPITQLSSDRIYPFPSSARSFNQVERFLFSYYLQVVVPDQSINCHMLWHGGEYCEVMNKSWTPLAVSRKDSLDSLFLNACRYLSLCSEQQPERRHYYMQLATRYKLSCMRALNEAISSEISALITDTTVATVVMLGFDEILLGDIPMSRQHALGALQMVKHNGGFQTLGLNGFLEYLVEKLWSDVHDRSYQNRSYADDIDSVFEVPSQQ
ncbi:hypothetical protein UA08_07383 [Talaromyces atroroseus]|uniref:Uncharacterized protein n=1 Tax=Talaromyces atroroseus TaxID=1441469 RepID=A0A225ADY6_TALAT|nr:hypothetical protein UA08_07383 [Talaromyces atroroseus]OKL57223.1 hypothetical protein UA08_07383 [Talaromyces atroroseus]